MRSTFDIEKRRIAALQRRIKWLEVRINGYTGKSPSRDQGELSALKWAVETLSKGHKVTVRKN